MPRTKTPSFIVELPLRVGAREERALLARLEAGRRTYNAVLDEALKAQQRMRESRAWRVAQALPKKSRERSQAFRACSEAHDFTSARFQRAAIRHKNAGGFGDRLGAHETQRIADRAFAAVVQYGFGVRGRPRFKGARRPLHSLEGKTNAAGIRWSGGTGEVRWAGLVLPARLAPAGADAWQEAALARRTKYARVLWRTLRGRRRWYVQLVQEGLPPAKLGHTLAHGAVVGIDVGPSTVAVVGDDVAALVAFCPGVNQPRRETRRLKRALDRSRRATNPEAFNPDGTWRRGARMKVVSNRYRANRTRLAETERRLAAERRRAHGALVNTVLSHGTVIHAERLSYKAFQRCFGRSVKVRAPGSFIAELRRKAESAGGAVVDLDTRGLRMSQYDHTTRTCTKKPLSQRWHVLGDGSGLVQRDVYSAFLARCVVDDTHHPSRIDAMWAAQGPALRRSGWWLPMQSASGLASAWPTVKPSERIERHRGLAVGQPPDDVALAREPESPDGSTLGTPWL